MKISYFFNIYRIGLRFPFLVLAAALLLTGLSLSFAKKLQVETNFSSLLPQDTPSVANLEKLKASFGSMGYLYLTVENSDPELARKFADQFAPLLEKLPEVRYVDYRKPLDYFKKRQWLFLDLEDLRRMEQRIDRSLELQEKGVSPVFSSMMDFADEEDRPDLTFEDIRKKYQDRIEGEKSLADRDADGELTIIRVKTHKDSDDFDSNRRLMAHVQAAEAKLKAAPEFRDVKVGYAGSYMTSLETVDLVWKEMTWVSVGVGLALGLILLAYFKKFSAAILIGIPLAMGMAWTGGLLYWIFGKVNILTAFSVSILAGLGSDYGIYLLDRFFKEIRGCGNFEQANRRTFTVTGYATFLAVLTTMAAFGSLLFSSFRVFVEFGTVGLLGLFLNYLAIVLVLPALLAVAHKYPSSRVAQFLFGWRPQAGSSERSDFWVQKIFAPRWPRTVLLAVLAAVLLSALTVPSQSRISLEGGQLDYPNIPSNQVYRKISQTLESSLHPSVFMVEGREGETKALEGLETFLREKPQGPAVYDKVLGLSTFIPRQQKEKRPILERMLAKYPSNRYVNAAQKREFLSSLEETLAAGEVGPENLPEEVTRIFISPRDPEKFALFIFPSIDKENREGMRKYNEGLVSAEKFAGVLSAPVDLSFVNADILKLIDYEAPRGLAFILIFLLGILFLSMKSVKRGLLIFVNLLGSMVLLSGALYLLGIPLNILNIAVFPIILGTGIDCFIHFSHHFDESGNLRETVRTDIPPILISNLTSIIGFGGLLFTSGAGLRSLGAVAVLGLVIMTLFCVFLLPRALALTALKREKAWELESSEA